MAENEKEYLIYPLVDEDGVESNFLKLEPEVEYKGKRYVALVPVDAEGNTAEGDDGFCEYVILRVEKDADGEDDWVSIEDDEEFDDVADLFDDKLSEEIDYDAQ